MHPQGGDGCWLWAGAISSRSVGGYGYIWIGGKAGGSVCAHRIAWLLFRGEIPEGMEIDHLCRVRNCVNPVHLRLVTHQENCQAGAEARKLGAAVSAARKVAA